MPPQQRGRGGGGRGGPPGGDGGGGRGRGGGGDRGGRGRGGGDFGGGRGRGGDFGGGRGGGGRGGGDRGRGGGGGFGGRGGGRGGPPPPPLVVAPPYRADQTPARGGAPPTIAPGVKTIGVRRPTARGTLGTSYTVTTNNFQITIPEATIHHYDEIKPPKSNKPPKGDKEDKLPAGLNMDLIKALQEHIAPGIFTPRVVYDGQKNIFASRELSLSSGKSQTFDVTLEPPREGGRPPRIYKVALKHVATISPTLLARYQQGKQSWEPMISTALAAINVVVRMQPIMQYPHNSRSFFTDKEVWRIGGGMELWRGYFQSVRPGLQSMLINIDIST
ncbi:hypothetical protein FRC09_018657, partial [Ceratobasidium sp. 395]